MGFCDNLLETRGTYCGPGFPHVRQMADAIELILCVFEVL